MTPYLTGRPWQPWSAARTLLDGCECLWVDVDGPHHRNAPDEIPVGATHLWAWKADHWLRMRLDAGLVATSILSSEPGDDGQPTTVRRDTGVPWGSTYERTAPWEKAIALLTTDTAIPLTFVAGLTPVT